MSQEYEEGEEDYDGEGAELEDWAEGGEEEEFFDGDAVEGGEAGESWEGTGLSQQEFFKKQEEIPVEISPKEPGMLPLEDFEAPNLGLHPMLAKDIISAGYRWPTPVQKWGIPLLLRGKDIMACAQTGSGKTAFYLFPAIHKKLKERTQRQANPPAPAALILGPTRELCVQIFEEAQKFSKSSQMKTAVAYGGTEYKESLRQVAGGVDILVATPGRLQDMCERNSLVLHMVRYLVLDEADRMLDMGFEPQIRKIVQHSGMPKQRQSVMTSATFPEDVQFLAQDFMQNYSFLAVGRVGGSASSIQQRIEWVEDEEKDSFLYGILLHQTGLTLVFVNTKQAAVDIEKFLKESGIKSDSIHGDRSQEQREAALQEFKSGSTQVLIATDVAARGLDIPNVALVIQYDLAQSVDDYVHRIGRTGRIGKKGIAIGMMNNRNKGNAAELVGVMQGSGQTPPPFLLGICISTGTQPEAGGDGKYGGQDVRHGKKGFMSREDKEKARKFTDFDKDAYGQGSDEQAQKAARTVGPAAPGSYTGAASNPKGGKAGKGGKGKGGKGW